MGITGNYSPTSFLDEHVRSSSPRRHAVYTLIWNTLDYPACAFPVTQVDPTLDPVESRDHFLSDDDRSIHALCECFK
jgi:hypothetical protein